MLEKYLGAPRREGRRAGVVGQPRPRRPRRARRAGRRLAAARPAARVHVDGIVVRRRRHALHDLPVVGRPAHAGGRRRPARRRGRRPPGALGLALPLAAGRHGAVPRRTPRVPRPRPGRLDRRAPAGRRAVRPHPPGAVGRRRLLARAARRDAGSSTRASSAGPGARRTSPSTPRPGPPSGSGSTRWSRSTSDRQPRPAATAASVHVVALGVADRAGAGRRAPGGARACRGSGRPSRGGPRARRTAP